MVEGPHKGSPSEGAVPGGAVAFPTQRDTIAARTRTTQAAEAHTIQVRGGAKEMPVRAIAARDRKRAGAKESAAQKDVDEPSETTVGGDGSGEGKKGRRARKGVHEVFSPGKEVSGQQEDSPTDSEHMASPQRQSSRSDRANRKARAHPEQPPPEQEVYTQQDTPAESDEPERSKISTGEHTEGAGEQDLFVKKNVVDTPKKSSQDRDPLPHVNSDTCAPVPSFTEASELLHSELTQGIISTNAVEVFHIATPKGEARYNVENPQQEAFSEYMQRITTRLLGSDFAQQYLLKGDPIPEFHYFITDKRNSVNASIVSEGEPPVVFVTKELLQRAAADGREDLLAAVMAHELTHYFIHSQIHNENNSKIEEAFGYGLPAFLLHYSGYQYTGMRDAFRIMDKSVGNDLLKYVDVHPGRNLSERIAEDAEGVLAQHLRRRQKDFQSIPLAEPTPVPKEVTELVSQFAFEDVIVSDFERAGFKAHPHIHIGSESRSEDGDITRQKLQFIMDNLDRWVDVDGHELGSVARYERIRTVNMLMQNCFKVEHYETPLHIVPDDVIPLLDKIISSGLPIRVDSLTSNLPGHHRNVDRGYIKYGADRYPPQTGMIHDVAEEFDAVHALATVPARKLRVEQAAEQAERFLEVINRIHPEHRGMLRAFDFGEMPGLPTLGYLEGDVYNIWEKRHNARIKGKHEPEGIIPPWEGFVQAALKQYDQTKQTSIADMLLVLGITDPRLAPVPARNPVQVTFYGEARGAFRYMNAGFPNLILDAQGKIIGAYEMVYDYYGTYDRKDSVREDLAGRRALFAESSRDQILEQRALEKPLMDKLQVMHTPQELQELLWQYPMQLAIPKQFMGGEVDPQDDLPLGSNAALMLTERLEFLAQQDPNTWKPVITALFSEQYTKEFANIRNTQLGITVHDAQRRLDSHYLDHPLSGKHGNFYIREYKDGAYRDKEIKIYLPDEMGMSLTHPYVQFVLRHTKGIAASEDAVFFAKEQALSLLDRAVALQVRTPKGMDITPRVLQPEIYLQLIGARDFAKSDAELSERLTSLRLTDPSIVWSRGHRYEPKHDEWNSQFLLLHARNEVYQYLMNNPGEYLSPGAFEESLLAIISIVGDDAYSGFETGKAFVPEIRELLEQQFLTNAEHDLAADDLDPLVLAKSYATFEKYGFFQKHPEKRWDGGYDGVVARQLRALREGDVDAALLRNFTETILYGCSVQSPELRKELVTGWGEAIKSQYGVDTTKAFNDMIQHPELDSYYSAITEIVNEVTANTAPRGMLHEAMLRELTEALETQRALTQHIFVHSEKMSKEQVLKSTAGIKGPLAEFGLDFVVNDERTRLETIDLLTGALTDEVLEQYINSVERRLEEARKERDDYRGHFFQPTNPMDFAVVEAQDYKKFDLKDPETRKQVKGDLRASYENFWDAKLEQRAYYMNLLAFPTKSAYGRAEHNPEYEELVNYVINKVLPYEQGQPEDSQFNRYTTFGRDLILSYIDGASQAEQRLLLSGLMVSARSLGEVVDRDETTIGKALALTLMNMGPAGVKLAQAVHSFPQTPEPIRNGMEGVKGGANWPTREEVFKRMESIIPGVNGAGRLTLDGIQHIGEVLGAGAYQYTLRASLREPLQGQDKVAVTLLRDHVSTFAQNEFRHIQDAFEGFVKRRSAAGDAVASSTIQAMRHVIHQASASSILETDYDTGKVQSDLLHAQYDGLTVRIGDRTIAFRTVDWLDHGMMATPTQGGETIQAYKVADIAPGKPFNTFSKTASRKELKDLGIGLQITEDMMTLSGKHFDHDRHGDNFNVIRVEREMQVGDTLLRPGDLLVTHYDLGAVNLEAPTAQEKRELGKILAIALHTALDGEGVIKSVLLDQITEHLGEQQHENNYLSAVLRGLLARGDFLRNLTPQDIQTAAMASFTSGTVDNDILSSLLEALTEQGETDRLMQVMNTASTQVEIQSLPQIMQ